VTAPLVSRRAAAALFLKRQWLDRPRGRRLTAATLPEFVARTCGLQIDSVNVVDRAHHLTLWSRFGPYDKRKLERLTYRKRLLFEYFSHVACFVTTRDLPLHRAVMQYYDTSRETRYDPWRSRNPAMIARVKRALAERGILAHADFERPKHMGKAGGWWDWKPATLALEFLWRAGHAGVHSRVHFHKRFAPVEHVLPGFAETPALTYPQAQRERLLRSLAAMGVAAIDDLRSYWTWPQWKMPGQRAALKALLDEGAVREVRVEGQRGTWFARAQDLPELERAHRKRAASRGTTLLSPFDSLMWHRERVHRLWGYFYRIEIYVPGHKRQHGYYSMPLLHDGQFVGRVDVKTHREAGVLEARHVHFEPWFAAGESPPRAAWGTPERPAVFAGLADALRSLATHVGVTGVKLGRVTPALWKADLQRVLRD
jgi:uncharacterized protein YcaQ